MCRSIKPLFNYDPPASPQEIEAAALQFVRKVSGYRSPSAANEAVFNEAVAQVGEVVDRLLNGLTTAATPKNREEEAEKARARYTQRHSAT